MTGKVRIDRRVKARSVKEVLHGLFLAPLAWLMASIVATAQENPAGSSTTLPEIRVIATTPVAPPRTPARAPAAAPTPARTPARTTAARAPAPTSAVAAA